MKENKITVIIDKPISEVFEFTTNPKILIYGFLPFQKKLLMSILPK